MFDLSNMKGDLDMIKPSDLIVMMAPLKPELMITNVVPRYEYDEEGRKTKKVIGKYANGFLLSVISLNSSTGEVYTKNLNVPIKVKMSEEDDSLMLGATRVYGTFSRKFFGKWYWNGRSYALSSYGEKFVSSEKRSDD